MITTTHTDKLGRQVTTIPDDVARTLRAASQAGWVEFTGYADGHSAIYPAGHPVNDLVHEVWEGIDNYAGFLVGESAYDVEAAWWADYPTTYELHVSAKPYRVGVADIRFGG